MKHLFRDNEIQRIKSIVALRFLLGIITFFAVYLLIISIFFLNKENIQLTFPAFGGCIGSMVAFALSYFLFDLKEGKENEVRIRNLKKYYLPALKIELLRKVDTMKISNSKISGYINRISNTDDLITKTENIYRLDGYCSLISQNYSLDNCIILKKIYNDPRLLDEILWEDVVGLFILMNQLCLELRHSTTEYFEYDNEEGEFDYEKEEISLESANRIIEWNKKICSFIKITVIPGLDLSISKL